MIEMMRVKQFCVYSLRRGHSYNCNCLRMATNSQNGKFLAVIHTVVQKFFSFFVR